MMVASVLGFQLVALTLDWSWLLVFPLVILARQVNLVEHNHAHAKVFHDRRLNDVFGWLCFLSNGVPLEFYEVHHVDNHHRYNNTQDDHSSMFGFSGCRYPDKPVSRGYYILSFPMMTICHSLIDINRRPGTRMFRRFWTSIAVISLVSALLISLDPLGFLTFFVAPWIIIFFGLGLTNYRHHYGCKFENPYNSSNIMSGLPYGILGFNIGYHASHHIKPALHWSLLPLHHEGIKEKILQAVATEGSKPTRELPLACARDPIVELSPMAPL